MKIWITVENHNSIKGVVGKTEARLGILKKCIVSRHPLNNKLLAMIKSNMERIMQNKLKKWKWCDSGQNNAIRTNIKTNIQENRKCRMYRDKADSTIIWIECSIIDQTYYKRTYNWVGGQAWPTGAFFTRLRFNHIDQVYMHRQDFTRQWRTQSS